jgi:hypothetical protein
MLVTSFSNALCFFSYVANTLKFTKNIAYEFTTSGLLSFYYIYVYHDR